MSYAIGEFIYGIRLTDIVAKFPEIYNMVETDLVRSSYSGNGEQPLWLGSDIIYSIDEASDMDWPKIVAMVVELNTAATPGSTRDAEFQKALAAVLADPDTTPKFAKWLAAQTPQVHLLWGSS